MCPLQSIVHEKNVLMRLAGFRIGLVIERKFSLSGNKQL